MEKKITYQNCTVVVHLPKKQDTVRKATERFFKEVERSKKCKGESKTES